MWQSCICVGVHSLEDFLFFKFFHGFSLLESGGGVQGDFAAEVLLEFGAGGGGEGGFDDGDVSEGEVDLAHFIIVKS